MATHRTKSRIIAKIFLIAAINGTRKIAPSLGILPNPTLTLTQGGNLLDGKLSGYSFTVIIV